MVYTVGGSKSKSGRNDTRVLKLKEPLFPKFYGIVRYIK